MSITPILKCLSMKLLWSPHTSPIFTSLTLGKEPNSSLLFSRRNYASWIVWSHIPTTSQKLLILFSFSKLLKPSLTYTKFELWILCGDRKLGLQVLLATKASLISSRILPIDMTRLSTMIPSSAVLYTKFELWILCGDRKLGLQVLLATKASLISSGMLPIDMTRLSTMVPSSAVLSSMKFTMIQTFIKTSSLIAYQMTTVMLSLILVLT